MKSDTDFANPYEKELYTQESKIKELEAKNGELEKKLEIAVEALEYTQRTDARIGHTDETEDGVLRGMPDKIMMRNRCKTALEKIKGTK